MALATFFEAINRESACTEDEWIGRASWPTSLGKSHPEGPDMQTAIEAMNRAIEDEERSQGSVHGFLVYWRYVSVTQVYVKDSCLHQVFVQ